MKNFIVTILLVAGVLVVGIPSAISFAAKQTIDTVRIELSKPIDVTSFTASVKGQEFDEMVLESSFIFDGEEIYDFRVVKKNEQNKNIASVYANDRKALIADVKGITDLSGQDTKEIENVKIKKVTFTGTKGNIDRVKGMLDIKKIEAVDEATLQQPHPQQKPEPKDVGNFFVPIVEAASTQFYPMYQYLPTSGTSYINNSSVPGERYTLQYMQWNNNYFATDETYEHKIYLYNYDGSTFLNGRSTSYPNCYPTVTYAATTWGSASQPYLDTRLAKSLISCEIDELSYTIGASHADQITTSINHYTYIRTTFGNASTDQFKLQGQVGYRFPESCNTTWCAFKYKIYNVIPSWSSVPTSQQWTFSGIAPQEAPSNLSITDPTSLSLTLRFTDNTFDESSIRIERRVASGSWSEYGYFGLLNYTGNWYWTNTGLQSNTVYCYRLRAKNNLGYSSYSETACGIIQ